jgi:hypothetical protein
MCITTRAGGPGIRWHKYAAREPFAAENELATLVQSYLHHLFHLFQFVAADLGTNVCVAASNGSPSFSLELAATYFSTN